MDIKTDEAHEIAKNAFPHCCWTWFW